MPAVTNFPDRERILKRWDQPVPTTAAIAPPQEWIDGYLEGFDFVADIDRGVDADADAWPNSAVFWWLLLDDAGRAQRVSEPWRGEEDGRNDAERLNDA